VDLKGYVWHCEMVLKLSNPKCFIHLIPRQVDIHTNGVRGCVPERLADHRGGRAALEHLYRHRVPQRSHRCRSNPRLLAQYFATRFSIPRGPMPLSNFVRNRAGEADG
jgi:hypothetical protein